MVQYKGTVPYFILDVFGETLQFEITNIGAINNINGDFRLEILYKTIKLLNNNLAKLKN